MLHRSAEVIAIAVLAIGSWGCRKASTPDPVATTASSGVVDLSELEGGEGGSAGEGAAGSGGAGESAEAGANADGGANAEANADADADADANADANANANADASANANANANANADASANANAPGTEGSGAGAGAGGNPAAPGAPAGNVEFLNVQSAGGVTGEVLGAALAKAKERYRGCFGKALAADPSSAGTLKLRVSLDASGKVTAVSVVGGNVGPGPLVQCSVATTKSLKLTSDTAPSKGSFDVRFFK